MFGYMKENVYLCRKIKELVYEVPNWNAKL